MTEIKLTLEDPALFAQQLKHAAEHFDDGRATPIGKALHMAAHAIEEQVKPTIEEPTGFASVVKARDTIQANYTTGLFWIRTPDGWVDDASACQRAWAQLDVIEVLRIGVGEAPASTEEEVDQHQAQAQKKLATWEPLGGFSKAPVYCIGGAIDTLQHAHDCPAPHVRRFCKFTPNCRMADGHDGGCRT